MITNEFDERYYKLGLHLHTKLSDGAKTPEEVAKEYKSAGFDAIAFTDHWVYGEGGTIDGLHIIPGCEYNLGMSNTIAGVVHIVSLFAKSNPNPKRDATVQEVVDAINAENGIAVLAHPAWSVNTPSVLLDTKGFVATEIYNAVSDAGQSLRPYSDMYVDICANAGAYPGIFATDDAHAYNGADNCLGWVMVKADEFTNDSLAEAIRKGNFFATQGPELYVVRENKKLKIYTSPCSVIGVISNISWAWGHVKREENLTYFEYEIRDDEKWVRVEARDANGKRAWSNIFVI
ncbi:MAG: PHP domain-containing protein [Kiritimatiellae bacterium]|nr:PHP domain-containing protein [Kiritimatiellia bacterium]